MTSLKDLLIEVVSQAMGILVEEGIMDVEVRTKPGVWATHYSGDGRVIQFGVEMVKGVIGYGRGAIKYYTAIPGRIFYHKPPAKHLSPTDKLTSVVIEEVAHAIARFKGGARHGHNSYFRYTFMELWLKYSDGVSKALAPKIAIYTPEVEKADEILEDIKRILKELRK